MTIELDLAHDLLSIEADPVQLGQAILNLVSNAADALEEGGGRITIRTHGVDLEPHRIRDVRPMGALLPVGATSRA